MKQKKIINDIEIEYMDVIIHTTTTKFKLWDRIKILLGKRVTTTSSIYTLNPECLVQGSEARASVERLIKKKSIGFLHKPTV